MDSTPSTPTAKRPRNDDPDAETSPPIVQSDIWYDDGNAILQAGQMRFRIHRSILTQHSNVFRDMFLVGSSQLGEVVDGCPLVVLHDSPEDVAHLLRAIYDPLDGFKTQETMDFPIAAAIIRLGKKYGLQKFYSRAVALLEEHLPSSLDDFGVSQKPFHTFNNYDGLPFDILRVAREANVLCVLPQALFDCCHSEDAIPLLWEGTSSDSRHIPPPCPSDQMICVLGWSRLCKESEKLLWCWARDPVIWRSPSCTSPSACRTAVLSAASRIADESMRRMRFQFVSFIWKTRWTEGICPLCAQRFQHLWSTWRQKVWDDLPSYYDLPPWDELRAKSDL